MMDTFVSLIIKKKAFVKNATFKTYLFVIAKNKALDYLRKHKKDYLFLITDENSTDYDELEDKMITSERNHALHKEIEKLPQGYKLILHLMYFEKMSCDEIAIVLKKDKKQVYNLILRARKKLKLALEKENLNEDL